MLGGGVSCRRTFLLGRCRRLSWAVLFSGGRSPFTLFTLSVSQEAMKPPDITSIPVELFHPGGGRFGEGHDTSSELDQENEKRAEGSRGQCWRSKLTDASRI